MQDLPECSGGRQRAIAPERVLGKDGGKGLSLGRKRQSFWSGVGVGTCLHTIPKAKGTYPCKCELTLNYFDSVPDTRTMHSGALSGMHPILDLTLM